MSECGIARPTSSSSTARGSAALAPNMASSLSFSCCADRSFRSSLKDEIEPRVFRSGGIPRGASLAVALSAGEAPPVPCALSRSTAATALPAAVVVARLRVGCGVSEKSVDGRRSALLKKGLVARGGVGTGPEPGNGAAPDSEPEAGGTVDGAED